MEIKEEIKFDKDQYLRLAAEFDNYKKRIKKEKEYLERKIFIDLITPILEMDNDIDIAISSMKEEDTSGISLIHSKLKSFLIKNGVEEIQTVKYDKDLHEVVSLSGDGKKIISVVKKGYSINGNPIIYPKVILG